MLGARDQSFGGYSLAQRSVADAAAPASGEFSLEHAAQDDSGAYRVTLLDLVQPGTPLEGKRVRTIGQLQCDSGAKDGKAQLYQFVVVCCLADAMPVHLAVHGDALASLSDGDWLEVAGTLERGEMGLYALSLTEAVAIPRPPPHRRYLYVRLW